ncbi:MAG: hypothetical protein QXN08_06075 [Nitrososphaerales archaeon]
MVEKIKLAIEDCALCGGCEIALADLGTALLDLFDKHIDLVYAPILASTTDYDKADITLVIGAIRSDHDLERVKAAREKSKIIVSFGTCPSSAGLVGLANLFDKDEMLKRAYGTEDPSKHKETPKLLDEVKPLSKYIHVDYIIPGCPPPQPVIKQMLKSVLKGVL